MAPSAELVQQIHAGQTRLVVAVTGGGSGAISALLTVPGASRTVLEAVVPYSAAALTNWLGARPEQFCSEETARIMAMNAFRRAERLDPSSARTAGIACTASLASDRPKRGPHRAYIAYQTADTTAVLRVELKKDARTRSEEEQLVAELLLGMVAAACDVQRWISPRLHADDRLEHSVLVAPAELVELLAGQRRAVCMQPNMDAKVPTVVMPGAFHPLHAGHREIAAVAAEMTGENVAYELSIENVDKPPLDFMEMASRKSQFAPDETLWLSRAATFVEKAVLFPAATFVVGADTILRIADPRYYGQDPDAAAAAIAKIASRGCQFLVFGRVVDGKFRTLANLALPDSLKQLCREVPGEQFRSDISSTDLRRRKAEPDA